MTKKYMRIVTVQSYSAKQKNPRATAKQLNLNGIFLAIRLLKSGIYPTEN
jgi:hypothetical protein